MGLGAFPAVRPAMAGHARDARHLRGQLAMHDCDVMICRRRALRRPHHRPARRLLAGLEEDPHRHRPVLDQQERQGRSGDRRRLRACARATGAVWRQSAVVPDKKALALVGADREMARAQKLARLQARTTTIIKPQYAIQRLYELTKGRDVYITTEVGQHQMWAAQFFVRGAEPLDDLGRPRHHGLWPAGGGRRAGRASRQRW
jgi:acetolactate synthase-1/2/3 large subunit